jgi:glucose-6-phosphate isomerase
MSQFPVGKLTALTQTPLAGLLSSDPDRLAAFAKEQSGIYFDFAKTHIAAGAQAILLEYARSMDIEAQIAALFSGAIVNPSEGRAATHTAERGEGAPEDVALAKTLHSRMATLVMAVEEGLMGDIRHIIHLGIGGSALGPEMLLRALGPGQGKIEVAVVSNIDGAALEPVLGRFDPHKTLLVLASKSFTTAETFLNARSVMQWMEAAGVADVYGRIVALTCKPDKAAEWGVDDSRILPFAESVGGRYSLWSSIGFSVAVALGYDVFEQLLEGAAEMDRHFRDAPLEANIPLLAALIDQYYAQVRGCQSRAVFAYDERLALVPPYLQQLEMESNGKSVTTAGEPLALSSAAIVWGGVGTDAQHAVFQLLHQGTHLVPTEFLAVIEPGHDLDPEHHIGLLMNCFAQGAALMQGQTSDDPDRNYPGDRPSVTLLLDRLDARTLGALIAFYEHRTFANAVLLGINPFDQFGVELGKAMANSLSSGEGNPMDISTETLKARAFAGD